MVMRRGLILPAVLLMIAMLQVYMLQTWQFQTLDMTVVELDLVADNLRRLAMRCAMQTEHSEVAPRSSSTVISGTRATGKIQIAWRAEHSHQLSEQQQLVRVNCTVTPDIGPQYKTQGIWLKRDSLNPLLISAVETGG